MKKMLMYLPVLLLVVFVGCNIITGNKMVVIEIEDKVLSGDASSYDKWRISKEDHQTWKDHEADLKHVVDLGFVTKIINFGNGDATAKFWVSSDSTYASATEIEANATLVLSGITVPVADSVIIKWQDSYDYLENFDTLKKLVLDGEFWLYATAISSFVLVEFKNNAVVLTINAEP